VTPEHRVIPTLAEEQDAKVFAHRFTCHLQSFANCRITEIRGKEFKRVVQFAERGDLQVPFAYVVQAVLRIHQMENTHFEYYASIE
jgi:hypothetical protein